MHIPRKRCKRPVMNVESLSLKDMLKHIDRMVNDNLHLWHETAGGRADRINLSENVTYLVRGPGGQKSILRVHRAGYHTAHGITCELAWLEALQRDTSIKTAAVVPGRNGAVLQSAQIEGLGQPRFLVLFQFLDGSPPDESGDLSADFEDLGRIAAACHDHVMTWTKPAGFERLIWDEDAVFGTTPTWGNWRDAPGVTADVRDVLERVETKVRNRLGVYGKSETRFNLIHADMRLANLLIGPHGTQVIDFDDCGFGWLMYDFAAAISFIEDDPRVPDMKTAWVKGYRSVRNLSPEDEAEIETMIMLRRMALLAWIGSHIEAPEPQALAPDFAERTASLGRMYLAQS